MASVSCEMSFLEPWPSSEEKEAPYVRGVAEAEFPSQNFQNIPYSVQVADARPIMDTFTLDKNGFAWQKDTSLSTDAVRAIRLKDKELVAQVYYPLVENLIKSATGATRVIIFDHTYRKRDPALNMKENPNGREQPATVVHCDQSALGASRRVERHAAADAARLLKGRCQIINVWRPIHGIVEDWPLATMDYQTMRPTEVHPTNIFREQHDFMGQTVSVNHSPTQKWYYLHGQSPEEVTMIKIWDNKHDVANMCAHCAFQHPGGANAKVPRESIEVRCLVFYEIGEN